MTSSPLLASQRCSVQRASHPVACHPGICRDHFSQSQSHCVEVWLVGQSQDRLKLPHCRPSASRRACDSCARHLL
eukprot:6185802-Amphidinium_carterae.1